MVYLLMDAPRRGRSGWIPLAIAFFWLLHIMWKFYSAGEEDRAAARERQMNRDLKLRAMRQKQESGEDGRDWTGTLPEEPGAEDQ
jgi:hypothetical protein